MSGDYQSFRGPVGSVLFLDDEPDIVDAFCIALKMMGLTSLGFTHPQKALERFAEDPHSVLAVITDYTMPQMPCADFVRRLRSIDAGVSIHLCTGNAQHEIQEISDQLGIRSILYKPFDFQTLQTFMARIVGGGA